MNPEAIEFMRQGFFLIGGIASVILLGFSAFYWAIKAEKYPYEAGAPE